MARHGVVEVAARRGAARQQHHPGHAGVTHQRERLADAVIAAEQEHGLHVAEVTLERLGAVQVAQGGLYSGGKPEPIEVGADERAHPLPFACESPRDRAAGVPGCTSHEDHGSTVWTAWWSDIRELPEPAP